MQIVMSILGAVCVLVGLLLLLQETSAEKTKGVAAMIMGIALLILGSDLGRRVQNLKLGETGVEMSFSQEPAPLTPAQVSGAQRQQQLWLAPQGGHGTGGSSNASQSLGSQSNGLQSNGTPSTGALKFTWNSAEAERRYQEQTEALHQALQAQGFTAAPNPAVDLGPGTVVRIAPDGKLAVLFSRVDAFPMLKVQASTFDFLQFTSLGGTRTGFKVVGVFVCEQGFREDMSPVSFAVTPVSLAAEAAMSRDASLKAVRSVLGCYGREVWSAGLLQSSAPQKRYILGFQLATTLRR
jgi:hypothetical protein